ncbi:hypothetical protein ATCC90586_004265 [Pythium insidiosum]|nr:hypothetical protein ATCC90586_004265 [Pythium insidiosum]
MQHPLNGLQPRGAVDQAEFHRELAQQAWLHVVLVGKPGELGRRHVGRRLSAAQDATHEKHVRHLVAAKTQAD